MRSSRAAPTTAESSTDAPTYARSRATADLATGGHERRDAATVEAKPVSPPLLPPPPSAPAPAQWQAGQSCWFRESALRREQTEAIQKSTGGHFATYFDGAVAEPGVPHAVVEPPPNYRAQYSRLAEELQYVERCVLCGDEYRANGVGRLLCAFHPMEWYARYAKLTPYRADEAVHACVVCRNAHQRSPFQRALTPLARIEAGACTRVDHTSNADALFDHLLLAVPTFFASHLAIFFVTGGAPSALSNVLLVDRAEQLAGGVVFDVPGLGVFRRSVLQLYSCMSAVFDLGLLDDALRDARRGTKDTISLSATAGIKVTGSERKQELYDKDDAKAQFVPFYILARIQQRPGTMYFSA